MVKLMESKLLSFNLGKSAFVVVGKGKKKESLDKELEENPLTLCDKPMKRASEYTYLGTILSEKGVGESVVASVKGKVGRVKQMIFEIKAVVEDCRNNTPGAFITAVEIWEAAVIPYLYHASECWVETPKEALETLNGLQETWMRTMLATSHSCPIIAMYWELGAPMAEHRIMSSKLRFYHHIVTLSEDSVAHKIYQEQRRLNLRSLTSECRELLANLNINEDDLKSYSKLQWKVLLKKKMKAKIAQDLLERMKRYKKVDYFEKKEEVFQIKDYFKSMRLEDCRMKFSIESETVRTVKSHFFSDKGYANDLWKCQNCEVPDSIDSITHLRNCEFFSDLRLKYDIDKKDTDLVAYFKEIVRIRNAAHLE